jgi:outer membrane protein, heavy metal efflux system
MCKTSTRSSFPSAVLPALALACACLLVSCQSYQPEALDAPSHLAAWRDRTPADDQVSAFSRQLATLSSKPVPFNPSDGLTLAEAELVALVFNPDLRLARLRAGVAKASAEHAGRWDDPQLAFDVLKVAESVPDPWLLGGALSLTLPVSGRLQVERTRAEAAHQAALAAVAESEWQTLRDLRAAWLAWSANQLRLEETGRLVAALDSITETTDRLAESGELPRTEAMLFSAEQESRKASAIRLRALVAEGEQEIRSLLGLSPQAPTTLRPSLANSFASGSPPELEDSNPTLIRLRSEYAVAELALLSEIRKQYPDIELGPQFEREDSQSKIGLIAGIPIPFLNANKGGIATASAERELARAAFETGVERAEGRLATLRARLDGARASRVAFESKVAPLVDAQLADARRLLELGEGASLVLLESLARSHQAKLDLIEARYDEHAAENEISHLLGFTGRTL